MHPSLSHFPWESPELLTYPACRRPSRVWPLTGRICSRGHQRWCVLPHSYTSCADKSWIGALRTGTEGVVLNPPFSAMLTSRHIEARGLQASTVPPPSMPPLPRSFLPVGIEGWHHLGQSTFPGQLVAPSRWATPVAVKALQWSTPEACKHPRRSTY